MVGGDRLNPPTADMPRGVWSSDSVVARGAQGPDTPTTTRLFILICVVIGERFASFKFQLLLPSKPPQRSRTRVILDFGCPLPTPNPGELFGFGTGDASVLIRIRRLSALDALPETSQLREQNRDGQLKTTPNGLYPSNAMIGVRPVDSGCTLLSTSCRSRDVNAKSKYSTRVTEPAKLSPPSLNTMLEQDEDSVTASRTHRKSTHYSDAHYARDSDTRDTHYSGMVIPSGTPMSTNSTLSIVSRTTLSLASYTTMTRCQLPSERSVPRSTMTPEVDEKNSVIVTSVMLSKVRPPVFTVGSLQPQ